MPRLISFPRRTSLVSSFPLSMRTSVQYIFRRFTPMLVLIFTLYCCCTSSSPRKRIYNRAYLRGWHLWHFFCTCQLWNMQDDHSDIEHLCLCHLHTNDTSFCSLFLKQPDPFIKSVTTVILAFNISWYLYKTR